MANSLNTNATVNGNINGLTISENGAVNLTPLGSTAFAESTLVSLGAYQLIATGSGFGTASVIYAENTSVSGTLNIALSASNGTVSNFGTIPQGNAANGVATLINWNNTFNALYASANISASFGVFVIASA